jgi:DNA-directed RNA polymerase specialized sigma24 family protein
LQRDRVEIICWDGLEEHAPALRAWLGGHCRDANQADDLAQEALVRAARFRTKVHDERNLRGWILRIGSSVLRDQLRREGRLQRIDGADDLLERHESREPEPGGWHEDQLSFLEGQTVDRAQLMAEVDLALAEAEELDRRVLARLYGAGLCRECPDSGADEALSLVRRKERLWRARQRLHRRLTARVRCAVRSGDEFAPARLAETCTGGGALALVPEDPVPGARRAPRG